MSNEKTKIRFWERFSYGCGDLGCNIICSAMSSFLLFYYTDYVHVSAAVYYAKNIEGPWSEPVYLHSSGFDASILHDDDGRKYIVSLDWETREGYEKPGTICMVEYDPKAKRIIGYPKRIWRGGTDRGCIEAPHLTKRNGYYYIMCAEGGTHSLAGAMTARISTR